MYFHIDESGNTGGNLFDANQPRLSYGVLSSTTNADARAVELHRGIQKKIGAAEIHANHLGIGGLSLIADDLQAIQSKMEFDFDYYFIDKPAYALVSFFEAVFDAGLNPAVKWDIYWTPLRYLAIHKLTSILDEGLLRRSWELCCSRRIEKRSPDIAALLTDVRSRVEHSMLDARAKEVICDALTYGIAHPQELDFGTRDERKISPNAIGFQFVVSAIARRMRKKQRNKAAMIVVDQQQQFNQAQIETHQNLGLIAGALKGTSADDRQRYLNHPMFTMIEKDDLAHRDLPDTPVTIMDSAQSIGLQIVDVYLWIANRVLDRSELPPELGALWQSFATRSLIDGISFEGMATRYARFEQQLPQFEDLTDAQRAMADKSIEMHRAKVRTLTDSS